MPEVAVPLPASAYPTVTGSWLAWLKLTVKVRVPAVAPVPSVTLGESMASVGRASGVPVASAEAGPSWAPVRVGRTRSVYCVPATRPVTVWLVPVADSSRPAV